MASIPQLSFQTPDKMGLKTKINTYSDVNANLNILDQYVRGQIEGNSNVMNKRHTPAREPFGNRYFVDTNTQCIKYGTDLSVNRYILVDDMKYMKDAQGNLDTSNYGLLYSAEGSLQDIDGNSMFSAVNMSYSPTAYQNQCVEVGVYLDKTRTVSDKKHMTIADCNRLDSIAMTDPNQCPPLSAETFENIGSSDNEVDLQYIKKFVLEDDFITKFYFGSITVIGLYILYRLYEKK